MRAVYFSCYNKREVVRLQESANSVTLQTLTVTGGFLFCHQNQKPHRAAASEVLSKLVQIPVFSCRLNKEQSRYF